MLKSPKSISKVANSLLFLLLSLFPTVLKSQVKNGEFREWNQGSPVGWKVELGAKSGGAGIKSMLQKAEDGSLQLSGNAQTTQWQLVSQTIDLSPGESLMFSISAKSRDLKREARQFDNCYVGVFLQNSAGKNQRMQITQVQSDTYATYAQLVTGKPGITKAVVAIFLSKSGVLNVKNVTSKKVSAKESFDVLVSEMDKNYSYFVHKKINWHQLTAKYRQKANSVATQPDKFIDVVSTMLAELKDAHIWISYKGQRISKFKSSWSPNYDFSVVDKDLKSIKRISGLGIVGRTANGLGYVRITSLYGVSQENIKRMIQEIDSLFDAPGIILDLRRNRGGAEPVAQQFASLFATRKVLYGRQKIRSGPNHNDLRESGQRFIAPRNGETYQNPVACLIGPGAVSSAEGFAMMFNAIESCTMIGQPTRGASGNPAPVVLPNGVEVWYSRWISILPNGKVLEDYGVQPEIKVEHIRGADPTFEKAKAVLQTQK